MRTRKLPIVGLAKCEVCVVLICAAKGGGTQETGDTEKPKKEAFPVTMDVATGMRDGDGKQKITVTLTIRKGCRVIANPAGHEDFDDLKTILRVAGKNVTKVSITYPKGEVVKDKVVGDYWVYVGTVTLEAVVQRPAPTPSR